MSTLPIILSQRIDSTSNYKDVPFSLYHYPKRYRNQVNTGDTFIYYQGDRFKRENRYYFGFGVIGKIEASKDGEDYYAEILEGTQFSNKVPIYKPSGGFFESEDYQEVREKPTPAWQSSARKISNKAFNEILKAANIENETLSLYGAISNIESQADPILVLKLLNEKYRSFSPEKKDRLISTHVDRGTSVTNALKEVLGPQCQICGHIGFNKKNGGRYIEAHHLVQIALKKEDSLCSDNVILVCPNCHREIHHGEIDVEDRVNQIFIRLGTKEAIVNKNTVEYLDKYLKTHQTNHP